MAVTVTLDPGMEGRYVMGNRAIRQGHMNIGTYVLGGVPVAASDFGLSYLSHLELGVGLLGYVYTWNKSTGKIVAWDTGTANSPLNEAPAIDLTAGEFRFRAEGF